MSTIITDQLIEMCELLSIMKHIEEIPISISLQSPREDEYNNRIYQHIYNLQNNIQLL